MISSKCLNDIYQETSWRRIAEEQTLKKKKNNNSLHLADVNADVSEMYMLFET